MLGSSVKSDQQGRLGTLPRTLRYHTPCSIEKLMEEDMVHRPKEAISEIPCQVNNQNCLNTVVTWYK